MGLHTQYFCRLMMDILCSRNVIHWNMTLKQPSIHRFDTGNKYVSKTMTRANQGTNNYTIPEIDRNSAITIFSEIGVDMEQTTSSKHACVTGMTLHLATMRLPERRNLSAFHVQGYTSNLRWCKLHTCPQKTRLLLVMGLICVHFLTLLAKYIVIRRSLELRRKTARTGCKSGLSFTGLYQWSYLCRLYPYCMAEHHRTERFKNDVTEGLFK